MESTPVSAIPFDLNTASVEALVAHFPDLGLLSAEDLVSWREKNGPITTITPLVDELGLPEETALALLRVTRTGTMAPGSGEFETSIFPQAALAPIATLPPAPVFASVAPVAPVATLAPAPMASGTPALIAAVTPAPDAAPVIGSAGSEARLAARLGLELEEARAPRAVDVTGVSRAVDPAVAEATEPEPDGEGPASAKGRRGMRPKRSFVVPIIVTLALAGNAGLGAFLLQVRAETQGVKAPVAALTGEMHGLRDDQAQTRTELTETRARLERQASKLETTIDRVEATETRQREADRVAKEAAKAEAREVAALTARLGRVEGRTEKATFKLDEAIKIIDAVQGKPAAAAEGEPPVAATKKHAAPLHDGNPSWEPVTEPRR